MTTTTKTDEAPEVLSPRLKLSVTKRTLARALAIGKIAASQDKTEPLLNAVNLGLTERGNLVVQATDRFMIARAHLTPLDPAEHNEDFAEHGVTVPLRTVTFLEKWLPLVAGASTVVGVTACLKDGLSVWADEAPSMTNLEILPGALYPKLGTLVRSDEQVDLDAQDRSGSTVLSSWMLNRVGRIAARCDRHEHVLLRPGTKPNGANDVIFRVADGDTVWADGIVMGVRTPREYSIYEHGL